MKSLTQMLTQLLVTAALALPGIATAQTVWTIDKEHTNIGFKVSHFLISDTVGCFKDFDATVTAPANDFTGGTVTFTARTASVSTNNEQRDGHLRSKDFFDSSEYPELKFTGTLVKESGKDVLRGNMTIRGVTRPVSFAVTYGGRMKDSTFHIEKAGFKISGTVNRLDYGMKWNETFEGGGAIVGADVKIDLNVEINRKE
ncbi:MAG: YceI family protein [Terracidiphilus sp.]|jgi:polyisoprenoid-binding protein YceI